MGKVLIVKDVDFSLNAIDVVYPDWYLGYQNNTLNGANNMIDGYFYIKPDEISDLNLSGKEVKFIKCYATAPGVVKVGIVNNADDISAAERGVTFSYSVSEGVNIIELKNGITLSSTTSLCVGSTVLTYNGFPNSVGWLFQRIDSETTFTSRIPIDLGGNPQE